VSTIVIRYLLIANRVSWNHILISYGTLVRSQIEWTLNLNDKSKFKVVVIYENDPTGRRAKHFYDKLVHALEDT
jgi:hypothetical protein